MSKKYRITKKKSTAIWLAVLFGIFSWIYTYKLDAWKFWLNLGMVIAFSLIQVPIWGIVAFLWVLIDQCQKPREVYENYDKY